MELLLLGIFAAVLLLCVFTGVTIIYAMILGLVLFFTYGLIKKKTWKQMLIFSWQGVKTAKNILLTFILIGIMTAVWRASGSIAFIVYYASGICAPSIMLLASFLLCSLVSFLTGTAFGTAATMGVICRTMAKSMNVSDILAGGAILAGIYFGDRCSPVSTSALLVSELTKTDLYENLKGMAKTAIVPFVISCTIYWTMGLQTHAGTADGEIRTILGEFYHLSVWTLLPVAVVLILSALRVNVKRTLAVSALCGIFIAVLIQKYPVSGLPALCISGFQPDDIQIIRLMGGGGILSNMKVIAIVGISSCYSGIFKGTDFLHGIKDLVGKLNSKITPFGTTLLTSVVTAAVSCNQTLSIMLTNQLCGENNPDKKEFALSLENSAVVVAPLIPWSIASAVPLAFIGAPTMSVCAAIYLYLLPVWHFFVSQNKRRGYCKGKK